MADLNTGLDAVTLGKLDAAIKRVNTSWLNPRRVYTATLTDQIALFDYQKGDKVQFWMRFAPWSEKIRSKTAKRDFSEAGKKLVAEIGYDRYDMYEEMIPISDTGDPLGLFETWTLDATNYAIRMPLRRIVRLLQQNPVTLFDDLSLFNTAHIVDPTNKKQNNFSNDLQFKAGDEAAWASLKDHIMQIKGPNGYLPNANIGRPVIWVPTDRMAVKFAKLFMGDKFVGQEITAGANGTAASFSIIATSTADIVVVPELAAGKDIDNPATTLDAQAANRYYVWLRQSSTERGVIVRIPRGLEVRRSSGGGDDHNVQYNNALAAWSWMEAGFGPGLPSCVFRVLDA